MMVTNKKGKNKYAWEKRHAYAYRYRKQREKDDADVEIKGSQKKPDRYRLIEVVTTITTKTMHSN